MNKKCRLLAAALTVMLAAGLVLSGVTVYAAAIPGRAAWPDSMMEGDQVYYQVKNADGWDIAWHSSNRDVATVTKKGRVTAQGPGETTISAVFTKKGKKTVTRKKLLTVNATMATIAREADIQATDGKILVKGYDWGPGVDRVIFTLPKRITRAAVSDAIVETKGVDRTVTSTYICDEYGNRIEDETSRHVALVLETSSSESGNPFDYDFENTFQNSWTPDYSLIARFKARQGDKVVTIGYNGNCGNKTNIISPDTAGWKKLSAYTGTYQNPLTKASESVTLQRASYEPSALLEDQVKNPLIIWLHGQGEGGTDPDIAILGNKVSALTKDAIQSHFTTQGGANGAYVFIAQAPTYWMDEGDGKNGSGDNKSRYTGALMDAINTYLSENPDVDTNRIYLTGCSNGGYMTVNMLIKYPKFFAAAIPNCEAYAFDRISTSGDGSAMGGVNETVSTGTRWLTDKKIKKLKNIPIWFLASSDDEIVTPSKFELPTYQALLKAGATNCWFSYYDKVRMTDDPLANVMGHWVWVYFFNDQATGVQDRSRILTSTDTNRFGFEPSQSGGSLKASVNGTVYEDCFDWLNAQIKASN